MQKKNKISDHCLNHYIKEIPKKSLKVLIQKKHFIELNLGRKLRINQSTINLNLNQNAKTTHLNNCLRKNFE